ncbi:hypothetical protein [Rubripirellula obstinata]|uniref:hypothetical protein n=1 Tax=Rubripirellula obstinata TaxID=406547 RepID=UPI001F37C1EC|nr:hypothetical protein [Rubripirellula obstinata]
MNSHPKIGCFGEVLLGMGSPQTPWIPEWLTRYRRPRLAWYYALSGAMLNPNGAVQKVFDQDHERVGFRGMYDQLDGSRVLKLLEKDTDVSVIHLTRENVLKQYVSRYIMRRHRRLGRIRAHTTKELTPVKVAISPQLAEKDVLELLSQRSRLEEAFEGHRKIELVYEEMIQGNQITPSSVNSICELLEVSNEFAEPELRKMNPSTLSSMLTNFDEWQSHFEGTQFEELLG